MASTIVTHHTASLTAVNARTAFHAWPQASRSVASPMAVTDQPSALAWAARSPRWARTQATRQSAEQNRTCSRRGVNTVAHCSHFRVSAIGSYYPRPAPLMSHRPQLCLTDIVLRPARLPEQCQVAGLIGVIEEGCAE